MMTKSIERAQKKVEENNFGVRKRLLEYDDVMNYQRDAIYRRRRNALFGDRLAVDIANNLYDVCEDIVTSAGNDIEELKLSVITTLGMDLPMPQDQFAALKDLEKVQ